MFTTIKKNRGFGIIEVLITTLVISLGLMAVASLQGRLISDSRGNKVVSEARSLCAAQLEDFRDNVVMGATDGSTADSYNAIKEGYDLSGSGFPKTITGINEIFTVHLCVEDLPNTATTVLCPAGSPNFSGTGTDPDTQGEARKRVVASCTWGTASNDERIDVESLITYESIRNMIKNAKPPASSVSLTSPNTNAGSSDDLQSRFKMPTGTTAGTIVNWGKDSTMGQHMKVDSTPDGNGNLYGTLFYYCDSRDITNTSTASGPLVYYEGDVFTRRVNYYPSFPDNTYREAIELFYRDRVLDPSGNMCVPKVRYNGGIIIPLKGRVYTASSRKLNGTNDNPAAPISVAASESGIFCAPLSFKDVSNTTTAANYACYIGGNCTSSSPGTVKEDATGVTPNATPLPDFWPLFDNSTAGQYTTYNAGAGVAAAIAANAAGTVTNAVAGEKTIVTQCPTYKTGTDTGYPDKVFSMVGPGGWRGKIGVLGTVYGSTGGSYDNVCFAEELSTTYDNSDNGKDTTDSARNYYTRRGSGSTAANEGINKPYMCHDFLIVNGSSSFDSTCRSTSGALKLATKDVMRDFISSSSPNTVDFTDKASCHIIHGTVPTGVTAVGVGAKTTGGTYDGNFECTMTKTGTVITGYECIGTSRSAAVKIASTAGTAAECYLTLATSNMNPTCNLLLPGTATYTVSGNLIAGTNVTFGTQTGRYDPLTALSFSGNGNCSVTAGSGNSYSYSCTYLVTGDSVLFDAGLGYSPNPKSITVASANVTQNITINGTPTYSLTIITTGAGGTTNPAPATYTYNQGDSVSITALPDTGYQFTGWTGACAGVTTPTCTITMDANKTVTPTFAPLTTYTLTIITSGSGGTTNPAAGTYTYTAGQTVTITATADTGFVFTGWSGGACTGTGTCNVVMNSNQTVTATFAPAVTYNLNIITSGSGGTTDPAPGVHAYNSGTVVNITATASTGYVFTGWSGDCTGTGVCTVTMDTNKNVTATFTPVASYNLNIITSGAGGSTTPAAGTYTYNAGTNVTITATPSTGYVFSGWSGDCTGTGTCSVTMTSDKTVTATFTAKTAYTLSIVTPGSGGTTDPVPGTHTYYSGDVVTVTAKPDAGNKFTGWSGACSGTALTCTVTMDMSKTVSATFAPIPSCSVNIAGNAASSKAVVTSSLGCSVTANANKPYAYTCPTASGAADGTVVTVSSGGVDKTVTIGCSTNGTTLNYTVNFP